MALVYGIPVNKRHLGFKILPETVKVERRRRRVRVQGFESTDSFIAPIVPIVPMLLVVMGAPKETAAFSTFLGRQT